MLNRVFTVSLLCALCLCTVPPQDSGMEPKSELPANSEKTSLRWRPNVLIEDFDLESLQMYHSLRFQILPLTDARENVSIIGKTPKDKLVKDVLVDLVTGSDVVQWCDEGFKTALKYLGIQYVNKKGDIVLECELSRFMVTEQEYQKGDIGLRISARNGADMLVWEGSIDGKSDLYLRPQGSDGNSECLSNTLVYAVYNLLMDGSFRDAVTKSN